jgi:hypothetical protein
VAVSCEKVNEKAVSLVIRFLFRWPNVGLLRTTAFGRVRYLKYVVKIFASI